MKTALVTITAILLGLAAAAPADAFWVARGWRGGVAAGGLRAPFVAREYYYPRCLRCAPALGAGIVAGAAVAGAAAGTAAEPSTAPTTTVAPASTPSPAPAADPTASQPTVVAANAAADSCAKGLSPDSKMIYDATVATMKGPSTIRDTVVSQTKALVMAGKIQQGTARTSAEAAGACLKLLAKS
jgi:hypothetical protein